jgi:hypothetical protein
MSFFEPVRVVVPAAFLLTTTGATEGSNIESSDMMLASKLVTEGDTT